MSPARAGLPGIRIKRPEKSEDVLPEAGLSRCPSKEANDQTTLQKGREGSCSHCARLDVKYTLRRSGLTPNTCRQKQGLPFLVGLILRYCSLAGRLLCYVLILLLPFPPRCRPPPPPPPIREH